ncbi:Abortive infection C-terminus [Butyrivibrio hungatei]|uniref:Abortive infection C-terminus n=1 Tax=Butyrivibrio hungatei TaxID=185008 RepID=A0A1G5EC01_9FIRM|nr:abortive infection family protein [Butyrivibrio hungatei]SCY24018.1 Abortive infection C-terminus [Butyrivibrio hungatei]
MENDWNLLKRKDIYAILDGDELLGDGNDDTFRMPYLKGTHLCELSDNFGLHQEYGASRWTYLENLMDCMIKQDRCDELLCYMFDLARFYQLESYGSSEEVTNRHQEICNAAIDKINAKLALGRHELQFVGGHFYITDINQKVEVASPNISRIDLSYVRELPNRCKNEILQGNYDNVITKSRTLMEEVLIFILEKRNQPIESRGDINKLYNQVKNLFNMQQSKNYDGRVNSLLSGLEKIVEAIGNMRNVNSDAHGVGSSRIAVKEREARLAMNAAMTFCEYLLSFQKK